MAKVVDIQKWATPKSVHDVRGFLCIAGYYRRMIKNFAAIATPLNDLLRKGAVFLWSPACAKAFDTLKKALSSEQVMAFPRPGGHYILDTDASDFAAGVVLSQVQDSMEKVITYWSKGWTKSEKLQCHPQGDAGGSSGYGGLPVLSIGAGVI
jgi:hypothetical protein